MGARISGFLFLVGLFASFAIQAGTFYADDNATGGGDGTTPQTAYTWAEATANTSSGDDIILLQGSYDITSSTTIPAGVDVAGVNRADVNVTILTTGTYGLKTLHLASNLSGVSLTTSGTLIVIVPTTTQPISISNSAFDRSALLWVAAGESLTLKNNLIVGPIGGYGIQFVDTGNVFVRNNTITGFTTGIGAATNATTFTNNIFDTTFGEEGSAVGAVFENNLFTDAAATPVGQNGNISGNPLFVNAAAGDYHLQSGSIAIDAGNTDPFENEPLPNGGIVNIGAYGNTVEATVTTTQYTPVNAGWGHILDYGAWVSVINTDPVEVGDTASIGLSNWGVITIENLPLPFNTEVVRADLRFDIESVDGAPDLIVVAHLADDSLVPIANNNPRTWSLSDQLTETSVAVTNVSAGASIVVDVAPVIQEILNKQVWEPGNTLTLLLRTDPKFTLGEAVYIDRANVAKLDLAWRDRGRETQFFNITDGKTLHYMPLDAQDLQNTNNWRLVAQQQDSIVVRGVTTTNDAPILTAFPNEHAGAFDLGVFENWVPYWWAGPQALPVPGVWVWDPNEIGSAVTGNVGAYAMDFPNKSYLMINAFICEVGKCKGKWLLDYYDVWGVEMYIGKGSSVGYGYTIDPGGPHLYFDTLPAPTVNDAGKIIVQALFWDHTGGAAGQGYAWQKFATIEDFAATSADEETQLATSAGFGNPDMLGFGWWGDKLLGTVLIEFDTPPNDWRQAVEWMGRNWANGNKSLYPVWEDDTP